MSLDPQNFFDLAQKLLAHARRLDHLRDIWHSCVSAPVAGSNTKEDLKSRSPKNAGLTYKFFKFLFPFACFFLFVLCVAGLAQPRLSQKKHHPIFPLPRLPPT